MWVLVKCFLVRLSPKGKMLTFGLGLGKGEDGT